MDDNLVRLAREIVAYRIRNPKMYEEYRNHPRYGLLIRIAELILELEEKGYKVSCNDCQMCSNFFSALGTVLP